MKILIFTYFCTLRVPFIHSPEILTYSGKMERVIRQPYNGTAELKLVNEPVLFLLPMTEISPRSSGTRSGNFCKCIQCI